MCHVMGGAGDCHSSLPTHHICRMNVAARRFYVCDVDGVLTVKSLQGCPGVMAALLGVVDISSLCTDGLFGRIVLCTRAMSSFRVAWVQPLRPGRE